MSSTTRVAGGIGEGSGGKVGFGGEGRVVVVVVVVVLLEVVGALEEEETGFWVDVVVVEEVVVVEVDEGDGEEETLLLEKFTWAGGPEGDLEGLINVSETRVWFCLGGG